MSNQDSSYEYDVEEYSQDVRTYKVKSNRKLPDDVVRSIYHEVTSLNEPIYGDYQSESVTKSAWTELKRGGYDKDKYFEGLECTTTFYGTDYGDSETEIAYDTNPSFYEEQE
jgi:hypothetical protein